MRIIQENLRSHNCQPWPCSSFAYRLNDMFTKYSEHIEGGKKKKWTLCNPEMYRYLQPHGLLDLRSASFANRNQLVVLYSWSYILENCKMSVSLWEMAIPNRMMGFHYWFKPLLAVNGPVAADKKQVCCIVHALEYVQASATTYLFRRWSWFGVWLPTIYITLKRHACKYQPYLDMLYISKYDHLPCKELGAARNNLVDKSMTTMQWKESKRREGETD